MIRVLASGPLTTVQDLGRVGSAALGVPRSGAFDRAAAQLANRLVGNLPAAAVLEITLGGFEAVLTRAATVAVTGALCPGLDPGVAVSLPQGARVRLGTPAIGLRSYLAVRGGIEVAAVLGSRSTDLLSGLGPLPVRAGDVLAVGPPPATPPGGLAVPPGRRGGPLRVLPGPRSDWFAATALDRLAAASWTVRPDSDRIGVRLDGPPIERVRRDELPSEPTLPGAVQVPADGRPILFGPDAPVTGGYPVLAVVLDQDLDRAAQLRPGDTVRFATAARLRGP